MSSRPFPPRSVEASSRSPPPVAPRSPARRSRPSAFRPSAPSASTTRTFSSTSPIPAIASPRRSRPATSTATAPTISPPASRSTTASPAAADRSTAAPSWCATASPARGLATGLAFNFLSQTRAALDPADAGRPLRLRARRLRLQRRRLRRPRGRHPARRPRRRRARGSGRRSTTGRAPACRSAATRSSPRARPGFPATSRRTTGSAAASPAATSTATASTTWRSASPTRASRRFESAGHGRRRSRAPRAASTPEHAISLDQDSRGMASTAETSELLRLTRSPSATSTATASTTSRSACRARTCFSGVGAVHLVFGSAQGLDARTESDVLREIPSEASPARGDDFGSALAAADFDGDGFDDLAIGAPFEDLGGVVDTGDVCRGPRVSRLAARRLHAQPRAGTRTGILGAGSERGGRPLRLGRSSAARLRPRRARRPRRRPPGRVRARARPTAPSRSDGHRRAA